MKMIRSYATPDKAVNVKSLIQQLVTIEFEKMVNTRTGNSPAPHDKITLGGDCHEKCSICSCIYRVRFTTDIN